MEKQVLRVKGIVKRNDQFLVIKRWYDDRIPDPFMWEFIDGNVLFGEDPEKTVERLMQEYLNVTRTVERPVYTWSTLVGDTHIVGIAYICSIEDDTELTLTEDFGGYSWIKREEFEDYIENQYVLNDINGVEL